MWVRVRNKEINNMFAVVVVAVVVMVVVVAVVVAVVAVVVIVEVVYIYFIRYSKSVVCFSRHRRVQTRQTTTARAC